MNDKSFGSGQYTSVTAYSQAPGRYSYELSPIPDAFAAHLLYDPNNSTQHQANANASPYPPKKWSCG